MHIQNSKKEHRQRRHAKVRTHISGTSEKPRLSVFRSNRRLTAQLIDDTLGKTLVYVSSDSVSGKTPAERAHAVGMKVAEDARKLSISTVVFDRGGFLFAGKVRLVAEGAREGGLIF